MPYIRTARDNFDWQVEQIINRMKEDNEELNSLSGDDLRQKLWDEYAVEFARVVIATIDEYDSSLI